VFIQGSGTSRPITERAHFNPQHFLGVVWVYISSSLLHASTHPHIHPFTKPTQACGIGVVFIEPLSVFVTEFRPHSVEVVVAAIVVIAS